MSIQDLTASLDLKQNLNIYATCKQADNLNLILDIYDNSIQADLSNYNVRLRAMKADKVPLIQEHIGITINDNVVSIEAHEQLTTTTGETTVELQFIDNVTGLKKATFNLVLVVVGSALEFGASISTATYTLLQELENKLDEASDFLENIDRAVEANSELKTTITNGDAVKNNLDESITIGNTLKEGLDSDIANGTNLKSGLETAITNATSIKNELDTFAEEHSDITDLAAKVTTHTSEIAEINSQMLDMMHNVKKYGAKGDGITNDTVAIQAVLDLGGNIYFPKGIYVCDIVYIKNNNTNIVCSPDTVIKNNTHCFTVSDGIKNVTFDGLNIQGSLKYTQITGVDSNNHNRIMVAENKFEIGESISGSNIGSIGQMDTKRSVISAFDGTYYTTNLVDFGFDGNIANKLRVYFPQNIGNFEWTSAIRGLGNNDGLTIKNCKISSQRGYFVQFVNTSNVLIENNVFDTCGMDMFNFGLNTIDISNIKVVNNIMRNQVNFGKQGIYLSSKSNKIKDFVFTGNIVEKCTESVLSFFYSDCVFDGVTVKDNRFTDVDLYAITGCGSNFTIENNIFETVDFTNSDKSSMARTCIDIGYYLNGYTANLVTDYRNINIARNKFTGKTAIAVRTINTDLAPKNVNIKDNYIDVQYGGIEVSGFDCVIENNYIKGSNSNDAVYQWCGLFFNGLYDNISVRNNHFIGETRIRWNQWTTDISHTTLEGNYFTGNWGIIGGNTSNLSNNDYVNVKCINNKIKTTQVQLNSFLMGEYSGNIFFVGETKYDVPFIRNLKNKRYSGDFSSPPITWRDTSTLAYLGHYYKIGERMYRIESDKTSFYAFKNDVVYDGTTFTVIAADGFLTA